MSIDYNEKFYELRKKISSISEGDLELNPGNNKYKNRLKQLEQTTNQKIEIISDKFTSLKNEFISLTSNYSSQKPSIQKSFEYSNFKNEEDENNKTYIKNLTKKISDDINKNIIEQQSMINIKFLELENKIRNIFEIKEKNRNIIKKDIVLLANNTKENIENLNMKIEERKNEEENILINIGESFKKEMDNVNSLIKDMKQENDNFNNQNKIIEINELIQNNFKKERKKRDNFQKNVLGILKDTCQKLSDNFYGNGTDNEYEEENEVNEEYENAEDKNNYNYDYNEQNLEDYNNEEEMEEQNDFIYDKNENINNENKEYDNMDNNFFFSSNFFFISFSFSIKAF